MAKRTGVLVNDSALQRPDCLICGRTPERPWVRVDLNGRVVEGCVGAIHGSELTLPSAYASWWYRPEAIAIRIRERRARLGR